MNPKLENLSAREKETWKDASGRAVFAGSLITDEKPGMLDMMVESSYPDPATRGPRVDFGGEILEFAAMLGED